LNELLETVVQITPTLVGVHACGLLMWDSHTEMFTPITAQGLTTEQQAEFMTWQIAKGEVPVFDHLHQIKHPILLSEVLRDNDLMAHMTAVLGAEILLKRKALVLFPLVARGEVLGAFLIDYDDSGQINGHLESVQSEEKLAIIQGIAHQTAIAVENIRLLKAQKEEAYVSVALLQVAQAVVSQSELSDILETIVRITPILVGVKRSAIYLWDEGQQSFKLVKHYGFLREQELIIEAHTYSAGTFPMLDTIRQQNMPVFCPLTVETIAPDNWDKIVPSNGSAEDNASNSNFNKIILNNNANLLMGFPLSVQGNILGAMLAEEAEAVGEPISPHARERRLEIITGISQQAALAIQNDLLRHEVVERERLERELQLAREIQKTFLPRRLPGLPGWDVDVRWRPARQVGGDFYDIFTLPNKQIGLVIADVADKGMPAALFMTLIRTLIRAAVHEQKSPAAVLEHVNKLLAPDSQRGMFVTVVYAVLSAHTGRLAYANAGHNLPLLLRAETCEIEQLLGGGMALGIMNKVSLTEHQLMLEPGDCLIFYTDGVTEAFSPSGEMYGEPRLHETIRSVPTVSARTMLNAIEDSVNAFIDTEPPSDDLTLLAIQRSGIACENAAKK
jgi:serine phosphatase RsbU (regulator of sigma subunit)